MNNERDFLAEYSGECLCHHGIMGQKWGVRRFQNKDGSLTSAGRKRYGECPPKNGKKRKKRDPKLLKELQRMDAEEKVRIENERNKAIKDGNWSAYQYGEGRINLYSDGKLGKHRIDFGTESGYIDRDEGMSPERIKEFNIAKARYEKEGQKVISSITEAIAKKYWDPHENDNDVYTIPGLGISRKDLKEGLVPELVTLTLKNPNQAYIDIRNMDGDGLADFRVAYDIDKDKVYGISYLD